jgi:hypothetical protein
MTIVVGTRDLLKPLQVRPDVTDGPVQLFPEEDVRAALETILERRPRFLVLEREFSQSSRGTAMLDRLSSDPAFASTEILVVSGDSVAPFSAAQEAPAAPAQDWRGTRRVPRIRMKAGIELQIDNTPAQLVDLSTLGAQVISSAPLKPNQRVRVALPGDAVRMVASVAWANFELPKGRPTPQYRAGLEFASPDARALEQLCVTWAQGERP